MKLTGVLAPIPTPFDDEDQVDTVRLRTALARWVATPLTGFIVLGSTGEAVFLDEAESDRIIAAARESVPSGRTLIAGTGRESTRAAVQAAKRAARLGADAVLVRTPAFFKAQMTDEAFVRHYTAVADASTVPVLLYNFTALTGVKLMPAAVSRLAAHPNIIGMKESGGHIAQIADIVASAPPDFRVLAGSASSFYDALSVGAIGGILALACIVPNACTRLYELTKAGLHDEARALQQQLVPLANLVGSVHGVPGLKTALKLVGCDVGRPRPPLAPLPDAAFTALQEALASFEEVELIAQA